MATKPFKKPNRFSKRSDSDNQKNNQNTSRDGFRKNTQSTSSFNNSPFKKSSFNDRSQRSRTRSDGMVGPRRQGDSQNAFGNSFEKKRTFEKPFRSQNSSSSNDHKYSKNLEPTTQAGMYHKGRALLTKNLTPGTTFFELEYEQTIEGVKYREIDPKRSKFAAAIAKGLQQTGMLADSKVLYLGASHGYTPSFFSDIVSEGMIFCLDFAPRVVRDLYFICEKRDNMAPIIADANNPDAYAHFVPQVNVVFQDIAQREQVKIFFKNCDKFLLKGGHGMLAIKARSIDVTSKPKDIFKDIRKDIETLKDYSIIDYRELDPFEKDHAFFVVRKR